MKDKITISCEQGHSRKVDATTLERLICSGKSKCTRCSHAFNLSDPVELECYVCGDLWKVCDIEEAMSAIDSNCNHCASNGFEELSFHIRGSWQMSYEQFKWSQHERGTKALKRIGRDDYWEGLVHFCTAEQFGAIYESGCIRAYRTGYYRKPAVCLTEATAGGWEELKSLHGDFGFVLRKRDVLKAGGGPVLYLPQHLIMTQKRHGGFDENLKPFINVVRTEHTDPAKERYDYLHEREWRFPHDISLSNMNIYGIISGRFSAKTRGWKSIFDAKMMYPEVVVRAAGEFGDENEEDDDEDDRKRRANHEGPEF
jgi:hypothetical protein